MPAAILGLCARLPDETIANGQCAEADHIYVVPENATVQVADGHFVMTRAEPPRREYVPVDLCLSHPRSTSANARSA